MSYGNSGISSIFSTAARGLQTGRQLKQVRQENELEDVRRKGLDAAKEQRKSQVAGMVKMQGLPTLDSSNVVAPEDVQNLEVQDASALPRPETQGMPKQPEFKVGDQSFGSKKEAERYADTKVPSREEIFYQDSGPKLYETLIAQGNLEGARDWKEFMDDSSTRKAMKNITKMERAALSGDHEGFFNTFKDIYNSPYYNDGEEMVGHDVKTDQDGNIAGFSIKMKRGDETWTEDIDGGLETALEQAKGIAVAEFAPQKAFDYYESKSKAKQAARSEAADRYKVSGGTVFDTQTQQYIPRPDNDRDLQKLAQRMASDMFKAQGYGDNKSMKELYSEALGILRGGAGGQSSGGDQGVDVSSSEYQEAKQMAQKWADSQAGWLSSDKADFKKFGGNRQQALQAKTMEFYEQITGRGGSPKSGQAEGAGGKTVVRTGRTPDGRRVVQYSDGTTETR